MIAVWKTRWFKEAVAVAVICIAAGGAVIAQDMPAAPIAPPAERPTNLGAQPQAAAQPTPPPAAPAQTAARKLSDAQLDQLFAPIALYPDPLLSQMLMASTYPLEVVEAARWRQEPSNKSLTGDALTTALKSQNWDPSIMALAPFPRVLELMSSQVQWTEQLGNAFLTQQNDVMASVQRLRHAALAAGQLKATPECHCIIQTTEDQITILPSEPRVVSIPVYNPGYVYGTWWEPDYPPIIFPPPVGFVYAPGFWIGFEPPIEVAVFGPLWGWNWFDWGGGRIVVDNVAFGRLDPVHAAFANGTWVHDPSHRRGVAYASAAVATRIGVARFPPNVVGTRGVAATFGSRAAAPAVDRFAAPSAPGAFSGAGRGFVDHAGTVSHGFVGHVGSGTFHAHAFARGAAPQIARGHIAPAQFRADAWPRFSGFARGPGGAPHVASPAAGPHGGGPHGAGRH